jgi:hypothetical protein
MWIPVPGGTLAAVFEEEQKPGIEGDHQRGTGVERCWVRTIRLSRPTDDLDIEDDVDRIGSAR